MPYKFKVGQIQCTVLHAGGSTSTVENAIQQLHDVDVASAKQALRELGLSEDTVEDSMNPVLFEINDKRILVDTGLGNDPDPIVEQLNMLGISPADIDMVFITHLHGDHYAGLTNPNGDLTYPNAEIVLTQKEWVSWMSDDALANAPERRAAGLRALKEKLRPAQENSQLRFVGYDEEIAPGICTVAAPGHTPGHTALMLESDGEHLFAIVDTLIQLTQFRMPDWAVIFDSQPEVAIETRHEILARAADENLLTLAYHLPFPGLGHVERKDDAYIWKPSE